VARSNRSCPSHGGRNVLARLPCYYAKMIVSFKNTETEDIFNGASTKAARKLCPESIWTVATRKLDQIDSVISVEELSMPPGNRLEKLTGDRDGQYSIRINDQYRICFWWSDLGAEEVEIIDYH
jgi:toxin HigB-1